MFSMKMRIPGVAPYSEMPPVLDEDDEEFLVPPTKKDDHTDTTLPPSQVTGVVHPVYDDPRQVDAYTPPPEIDITPSTTQTSTQDTPEKEETPKSPPGEGKKRVAMSDYQREPLVKKVYRVLTNGRVQRNLLDGNTTLLPSTSCTSQIYDEDGMHFVNARGSDRYEVVISRDEDHAKSLTPPSSPNPRFSRLLPQKPEETLLLQATASLLPYPCPFTDCFTSFANKTALRKHKIVHMERRYECKVCGARFAEMTKLRRHDLVHSANKKFSCSTCGRSFGLLHNLQIHEKTHTQEKPFACQHCGRRFFQKGNCRSHEKTHERHTHSQLGLLDDGSIFLDSHDYGYAHSDFVV